MAGYFQRNDGHVYEGAYKAGETLANGVFVSIQSGAVKKLAADGDVMMRVVEKTTLWGLPAVRLTVDSEGAGGIYLTENEFENYMSGVDFNTAEYTVPSGHPVKMRAPAKNDEIIVSVTAEVLATLAVEDPVIPASGGSVKKYTEPTP